MAVEQSYRTVGVATAFSETSILRSAPYRAKLRYHRGRYNGWTRTFLTDGESSTIVLRNYDTVHPIYTCAIPFIGVFAVIFVAKVARMIAPCEPARKHYSSSNSGFWVRYVIDNRACHVMDLRQFRHHHHFYHSSAPYANQQPTWEIITLSNR